jgi:hypothetical protein
MHIIFNIITTEPTRKIETACNVVEIKEFAGTRYTRGRKWNDDSGINSVLLPLAELPVL